MPASELEVTPTIFGSSGLFGIIASPRSEAGSLGLIILNAGMLPSAGPYRMNQQLVDALGDLAITTVRLDQSGKGESPVRSNLSPADAALLDYDETFSILQKRGVTQTILMGLCSGAIDSLRIAAKRDSVVGLVLLDGYVERTRGWYLQRWGALLRRFPDRARRAVSLGPHAVIKKRRDRIRSDNVSSIVTDNRNGPLLDLRPCYARVLARNVKILSVFSGDWFFYNHSGQLAKFLSPDIDISNLKEIFFTDVDHTYTLTRHRRRLIAAIRHWVKAEFYENVAIQHAVPPAVSPTVTLKA